ncbi:VWA containing CoxE family protein [Pantanalinema rosaneae CENA516]|uniref:VWA containing CoxE family protein n=1 Tax=Pantanalinema rosaneae TaxID=1620701 RepID=UPI003D6E525B
MSQFDPNPLTAQLFAQLRDRGFKLGIGEYLAAVKAIEAGGFGQHREQLRQTLRLLWCHSGAEQAEFDLIWQSLAQAETPPISVNQPDQQAAEGTEQESKEMDLLQFAPAQQRIESPQIIQTAPPQMAPLPVRAPLSLIESGNLPDFQTYYPLSRRSMVYNWRYLRRPVPNGPRDVLDIPETVNQVTQQGYFLAPAYRRREQNEARLLLLIDQNGSMMPFHRFTRDLVETVLTDSALQEDHIAVFYFQNVPREYVYRDAYLTLPISIKEVLGGCDQDTSVLIVSDAGAARGHRQLERIRATTEFLFQFRQHTSLIAWLNPMPEHRWVGSSAEILEKLVPMQQMDQDGFSQAIAIIRGQSLHHYQFPFL